MERGYRNLGYFLLALLPIFFAGFWIPYLSEIPNFDASITPAVHVHAMLLFAWMGLLIIQPLAIRYGAFTLHRMFGRASYFLMALIVPFALAMVWKEYQEKLANGTSLAAARNAELLSIDQLALIVAMYILALTRIWKHDVAAHMRYMICIALFLLPAGLARTLGYWFDFRQSTSQTICLVTIDLCLAGLIVYDKRRRLNARPYIAAFVAYNIIEAIWIALGRPV